MGGFAPVLFVTLYRESRSSKSTPDCGAGARCFESVARRLSQVCSSAGNRLTVITGHIDVIFYLLLNCSVMSLCSVVLSELARTCIGKSQENLVTKFRCAGLYVIWMCPRWCFLQAMELVTPPGRWLQSDISGYGVDTQGRVSARQDCNEARFFRW